MLVELVMVHLVMVELGLVHLVLVHLGWWFGNAIKVAMVSSF